jgi:hypothetical protein
VLQHEPVNGDTQILKLFPQVHRTIASDLVCGAEPSSQNGPSPLIENFTGRWFSSVTCCASMIALRLHRGQIRVMGKSAAAIILQ